MMREEAHQTIAGYNPEAVLARRCIAGGRVYIHTGEQYAAAEVLEKDGLVSIIKVEGRRYAIKEKMNGGDSI